MQSAAYPLHDISPFALQITETFGIRWYGLAYLAAFLVGWWMMRMFARRGWMQLAPEQVSDFLFVWIVPGTVLGGRLGHFVFYEPAVLLHDPLAFFRLWEGGMSAHGGILGIVVASWLYARRHGVSWLNLGDNLVVPAPIGLFFGRVANFINGELYGRVTQVPWAMQFPDELLQNPGLALEAMRRLPAELREQGLLAILTQHPLPPQAAEVFRQILPPRHPSQLYEAFLEGIVLFVILWLLRTRLRLSNGILTGVFFIGYAVLRSIGELFREPEAPPIAFLTYGQFLSLFLILIGFAFIYSALRSLREN